MHFIVKSLKVLINSCFWKYNTSHFTQGKNLLELKTKPPLPSKTWPNPLNAQYNFKTTSFIIKQHSLHTELTEYPEIIHLQKNLIQIFNSWIIELADWISEICNVPLNRVAKTNKKMFKPQNGTCGEQNKISAKPTMWLNMVLLCCVLINWQFNFHLQSHQCRICNLRPVFNYC